MGGAQSNLKPGDAKFGKRSEKQLTTAREVRTCEKSSSVPTDTTVQTKTAKECARPSTKPPTEAEVAQTKTAMEPVRPRTQSSSAAEIAQTKTAKEFVFPSAKPTPAAEIAQTKTAKEFVFPSAKPSPAAELAQTKTAREFVFPRPKGTPSEPAAAKKSSTNIVAKAKRSSTRLVNELRLTASRMGTLKKDQEKKSCKEQEEKTAMEPSSETAKKLESKPSSTDATATARETSAKPAKEHKPPEQELQALPEPKKEGVTKESKPQTLLEPKKESLAQKSPFKPPADAKINELKVSTGTQATTPAASPARVAVTQTGDAKKGTAAQKLPTTSEGATAALPKTPSQTQVTTAPPKVSALQASTAPPTDTKKETAAQKPPATPIAQTAALPITPSQTQVATTPLKVSAGERSKAPAVDNEKETAAQKLPATRVGATAPLQKTPSQTQVTTAPPKVSAGQPSTAPANTKQEVADKPSAVKVAEPPKPLKEAQAPSTTGSPQKAVAAQASSSNTAIQAHESSSNVTAADGEKWPIERERNIKRKTGYEYILATIEIQKGKKFGLMMVHMENRVIVNKVEDDSMCSEIVKYLDRVCDVEGIPVTDKELAKKQIIKGLKANGKVSLAIERPVTKERKEKVERLLSMIEHQPASVMLEPDVVEILARYNARLKAHKPPPARSALAKKGARDDKHTACVKSKIESVQIGMDNEILQEDLEKVPIKTYETSLARLQNQDQKDPNSICITEMIQADGIPNPPPT